MDRDCHRRRSGNVKHVFHSQAITFCPSLGGMLRIIAGVMIMKVELPRFHHTVLFRRENCLSPTPVRAIRRSDEDDAEQGDAQMRCPGKVGYPLQWVHNLWEFGCLDYYPLLLMIDSFINRWWNVWGSTVRSNQLRGREVLAQTSTEPRSATKTNYDPPFYSNCPSCKVQRSLIYSLFCVKLMSKG